MVVHARCQSSAVVNQVELASETDRIGRAGLLGVRAAKDIGEHTRDVGQAVADGSRRELIDGDAVKNSELLQYETGVAIDREQLAGGVEKYDARAPTGQRLKFVGPLRWRLETLKQSGGTQAVCNVRCGVAHKLDVIAAERLLIGTAPNRIVAKEFAAFLKDHLQDMVPTQGTVNHVERVGPIEVIEKEVRFGPNNLGGQNISQSMRVIGNFETAFRRRGIYKKLTEQRSRSSDFVVATYISVDPFASTRQYYAIGAVRDAIMKSFEDASDEGIERQA